MLHFKSHTTADIVVVDLMTPGLYEGADLDDISERLHRLIGPGLSKSMIIDFSRVGFIASSCLSLLIMLKRAIDSNEGQFMICGLRKQVQQVFRLSGLEQMLTLHRTRDDALAAMAAKSE
jgi:anti-anti-sigma factor